MRVYRCNLCSARFAVLVKRARETKGGKAVTCPLCAKQNVEEVDPVHEAGGKLAQRFVDWWKSLPSGDDS